MNMPFVFDNAWALLLLIALIPLYLWSRRSVDSLSPARRRWSLLARSGLFVILVLVLADVRWQTDSQKRAVVWLVDMSKSVGSHALDAYREKYSGKAFQAAFDQLHLITFADHARITDNPEDIPLTELTTDATDIAGALRFAEATFPPDHIKDLVLITDGQSPGDWAAESSRLRAADIRTHTVAIEPPDTAETLVREVRAPQRVREGEPFEVEAEIVSNRETTAQVKVYRNGVLVKTESVELNNGANRFSFVQSISKDRLSEFTLEVVTEDDTILDNNELSTLVHTEGQPKVLLLTDDTVQSRYLGWALKQEGITLDIRPPVGAPVEMSDLQNYELLIVDNVAATDLSHAQLDLMANYVRDFGGGFLMMGGDQSFGLGGYYRTPVEEILPVKCDFEKETENPSLGLALIIDKSGSMSGEKIEMAKEAARAAIELLSPRDFAGVVVFDGQAFWAAEMQSVIDKFGLIQLVSSIQPGGGTNLSPAMELAYSQLAVSPAKLKHVILLSDGHSQPGPFYELTTQMAQDRITVSSIGVGDSADRGLLEQIARWGNGRFYYTEEAQSIPQIFAKETMTASKSVIREQPFLPQLNRKTMFLKDVDFGSAPYLYGYVLTESKPTAEVWLTTEKGEPLLSTWRFGLGNVGAFTSDARNRWAVEWLQWDGYGPFWAQVVRKLMRAQSLEPFPATLTPTADGLELAVDTLDTNGNIITGLTGYLHVTNPDESTRDIVMEGEYPGRLAARLPVPEKGNYHLNIRVENDRGEIMENRYMTHTAGYPPEFLMKAADKEALSKFAESTGGFFNPAPEDLLSSGNRTAQQELELWPWLLGLALAVFMLDVGIRRWPTNPKVSA